MKTIELDNWSFAFYQSEFVLVGRLLKNRPGWSHHSAGHRIITSKVVSHSNGVVTTLSGSQYALTGPEYPKIIEDIKLERKLPHDLQYAPIGPG